MYDTICWPLAGGGISYGVKQTQLRGTSQESVIAMNNKRDRQKQLKYIELKTGWNDNGPAWIGFVRDSHSGRMVYFNNHAFIRHSGEYSNYIDVESQEEYWISGVKKNGEDRHWAGGGIITIDKKAVNLYLSITGMKELPKSRYRIESIKDVFPVERINGVLNGKNIASKKENI
mgnify:FL=1